MVRATWQLSASIAVVLAVAALVLRAAGGPGTRRLGAFAREFAVLVGLFGVYQYCGRWTHLLVAGAFAHAREVVTIERDLHLPSELAVQRAVLPHPLLVRGVNGYYEGVHLSATALFLVWVWWRHREHYPGVRDVLAASTLICLLLQLVPVAPPRMLPDLGFTDTALVYGQSVYGTGGSGIASQLAAMPSIHVLWAAILAWVGVRVSRSRWRWVLVAHLVVTVFVIVATANHWWLDGAAAGGVLALVAAGRSALRARLAGRDVPDPEPAAALTGQR